MFNMLLSAGESCGEGLNILPIVVIVILFLFLAISPIFTGRKRSKEAEKIHNSLQPGDVIETVGGVIGTILEIRTMPNGKDKQMVIETGVGENKTTMVFDIKAFMAVITPAAPTAPAVSETPVQPTDEVATDMTETKAPDEFVPPVVENIVDTTDAPAEKRAENVAPSEEQAAVDQPSVEEKTVEEQPIAEEKSDYVAEPDVPEVKPAAEEESATETAEAPKKKTTSSKTTSAPKASNAPKSSGTTKKKSTSSKTSTKKESK